MAGKLNCIFHTSTSADLCGVDSPGWSGRKACPPAEYSGVIMRTQHAHYGCGTVFRVAVYTGVPTVETLVVKEQQRE